MANSRFRPSQALAVSVLVLGLGADGAVAQQTPTAPPATVTTGALPVTAQSVVPKQINPIVPPAIVVPIARTRPATAAAVAKVPACKPGERMPRTVGACVPIAAKVVAKQASAKPAPAKSSSRFAKPKQATAKRG